MTKYLTYLAVFLLLGCSTNPPLLDGAVDFDAQISIDAAPGGVPTCRPEQVGISIYHCSECGDQCPPGETDQCVAGVCQCGTGPACGTGADCRVGRCVPVNPNGIACEHDDWCEVGEACIEGHCSYVGCVPETCNGYDDDCDGSIDNVGANPLAEFCLGNEPALVEPLPPCSRGVRVCGPGGEWTECQGDRAPADEVGLFLCDGVDNDCDGCVDGTLEDGVCQSTPPQIFDVLFLIDTSGSMDNKREITQQAVNLFSTRLSSSAAFQWGIVHIPGFRMGGIGSVPVLYQDLTDFTTFQTALLTPYRTGSAEPQWDAVVQSLDGTLGVSWRPGSTRILILFTDEPGTPPGHSTVIMSEFEMCETVTAHGAVLISVADPLEDFDDCAHQTIPLPNGNAGSLESCTRDIECVGIGETCEEGTCVTSRVTDLANELDVVIANPCGG